MLTVPCPTCGLDLVFIVKVVGDADQMREITKAGRHIHIKARPATCANGHTWGLEE